MTRNHKQSSGLLLVALLVLGVTGEAFAQVGRTPLGNICRLKGQEENVLRGVGLVVGLNGTGASDDPATMSALTRALELMGNRVATGNGFGAQTEEVLRNVKNAALVIVTATIPATGARSGDRIDCTVSAVNGKSLEGGRLISAALQGPNTQDDSVYGICEGALMLADAAQPMTALVHGGCQMIRDVRTPFHTEDGWVTIVIDPHHASFNVAESISEELGKQYVEDFVPDGVRIDYETIRRDFVRPIDASNIEVKVPDPTVIDRVAFVAQLLEKQVYYIEPEARVVCNPRTGSIVIAGDVEIGDVVFTHRNLSIETGINPSFQPLTASDSTRPKLKRLVEALATLRVPPQDVIEIIQGIQRLGKLHAKLVIL